MIELELQSNAGSIIYVECFDDWKSFALYLLKRFNVPGLRFRVVYEEKFEDGEVDFV